MTFPNLTKLSYQINFNTVINFVFSLFPQLQLYTTYTSNLYTITDSLGTDRDYYKYVFDSQLVVIVEVLGDELTLFSYDEPDNVYNIDTSSSVVGGYLPYSTLDHPEYLEI